MYILSSADMMGPSRIGGRVRELAAPDTSERSWLGAVVTVGSFIFGLVGVAALIWKDSTILLAIATGISVTLSVVLWAVLGAERRSSKASEARIKNLEADLYEARRQAAEWSGTSHNIAVATRSIVELIGAGPQAAPARVPRPPKDQQELQA